MIVTPDIRQFSMKKHKLLIAYNKIYYMIGQVSVVIVNRGKLLHEGNRVARLNEVIELFYKTNSKGTNCVKKSYRKS